MRVAAGWLAETRDATKHRTLQRTAPTTKIYSAGMSIGLGLKTPVKRNKQDDQV